ncbi:MAG: MoaD/ThiS family protein [Campylobacteraceae bacterium]|nr:MoaD/ThiS family protein [Campylobacteraceae bacterium]
MTITIKLFAHFRENNFKVEQRTYIDGISAHDIILALGITKYCPLGVLMVNSCHVNLDYILKEGDILALFPKVAGG